MARIIFTVEGRGPFPLDMLRHDCCWPRDGMSAQNMDGCEDAVPRRVMLVTDITTPTPDRWRSFGWVVVEQRKE